MRRRTTWVIAIVAVLALLAGAAWLGDGMARGEVESRIEALVGSELPVLDGDLDATVGGFLVTPQLLAGKLDDVAVTAQGANLGGIAAEDVVLQAYGVPIEGDGPISEVAISGRVPTESVLAFIQQSVQLPDGVNLELRDGEIAAVASLLGVPLEAYIRLIANPTSITFEFDRFVLAGATVGASDIPFDLTGVLSDVSVEFDSLPTGVELDALTVQEDGIRLEFAGEQVVLSE